MEHNQLRTRALGAGMASDEADGFGLLDAVKLSEAQTIQVTRDMELRLALAGKPAGSLPTYTMVQTELRLIHRVKENMTMLRESRESRVKGGKTVLSTIVKGKVGQGPKKKNKHKNSLQKKYNTLLAKLEKVTVGGGGTDRKSDWVC